VNPQRDHHWDLTPAEGIHLQEQISEMIEHAPVPDPVATVAGADVAYVRRWNRAFAALAVFRVTGRDNGRVELELAETRTASMEIRYPYIPGLLVFREGPALEKVWEQILTRPDLIIFDGAGIAHQRRCGLAAHLGWRWGISGIGCAKSRLIGRHEEVGSQKGDRVPLMDKHTQVGHVVRTRSHVKPLYVSPGYRMDFSHAVDWTLKTTTRYKLPEPTRIADQITKKMVREYGNRKENQTNQI